MTHERNKFLTEAMGECYHAEAEMRGSCMDGGYYDYCPKCKDGVDLNARPNFSTWEGFGKLWEWVAEQEWLEKFLDEMDVGEYLNINGREFTFDVQQEFIHPDRFANAVFSFLKERDGE